MAEETTPQAETEDTVRESVDQESVDVSVHPMRTHWPIETAAIHPSTSPFQVKDDKVVMSLDITLHLSRGVDLSAGATLFLIYIVNGSLDPAPILSRKEIDRVSEIVFAAHNPIATVTIHTLPLWPGTKFDLEVIAYSAGAGRRVTVLRPKASAEAVA